MERNDLIKAAAEVFNSNEKLELVHVTADGQCFANPHDANEHAKRMGPHSRQVEPMERTATLAAASGKQKTKEEHKAERTKTQVNEGGTSSTPGDDQGAGTTDEGNNGEGKKATGEGDASAGAGSANGGAGDGDESGNAEAASRSEAPAKAAPKKAAKTAAKKGAKKK
ncbi:MAG TPA: hypothetical protein PL070_08800 [Flavobacteriales bacterium]|nr:hypothetical protein [Flavobacteriales bacterium]